MELNANPAPPGLSLYRHALKQDYRRAYPPLQGREQADICIIGGGFAGLGTAASLIERGQRNIIVAEAHEIAHGASGRNGGFVFGGFSLDPADLVKHLGRAQARHMYGLTLQAVDKIKGRIAVHQIDCHPTQDGVILANWFRDPAPLRALQRFMADEMEVDWEWMPQEQTRSLLLSERYHDALFERNAFHFDPLAYAAGLARQISHDGAKLFERSRATQFERHGSEWLVNFAGGATILCRELVICCGGYIGHTFPELSRATLPIATYVMATEPLGERLQQAMRTKAAVYDTRFAFDYYRPLADTRLLWGGRIAALDRAPQAVARMLKADMLKVYPQLHDVQVSHAWSGLMGYARHKMPQIGQLPSGAWFAQSFGGHGVAPTTLAGELLAKAISGEASIPAGFAPYKLSPTYGAAGKLGAQLTYWWYEMRDLLKAML